MPHHAAKQEFNPEIGENISSSVVLVEFWVIAISLGLYYLLGGPLSEQILRSARRVPPPGTGGSWLGCGDLPAMGAVFFLGVFYLATVEALGCRGHPPST